MTAIKVLDHGYLTLVDSWGSDEGIIEAARMSTAKGFKGWGSTCGECGGRGWIVGECHPQEVCGYCVDGKTTGDEKLLRYLWKNKHATPFEMAGLTIEVQAPIFVFRQWHRHRTQSYNEMSARYTPLPNTNYMPTVDRCIVVEGSNKQAGKSAKRTPTHAEVLDWLESLGAVYDQAQAVYAQGLEIGIPKEIARLPVPVARYSRMRASANLRNWLAFLTLRMDSHAQLEVRVFAEVVGQYIAHTYPRTWELFAEGLK